MSAGRVGAVALALGVGALTGCGGGHSTSASGSASTSSASATASTLPAPTAADGKEIEDIVVLPVNECKRADLAQLSHDAGARLAALQHARSAIAPSIDRLIALYKRVNPYARIPYARQSRNVTVHYDVAVVLRELERSPGAANSTAECAPELAARLSEATGIVPLEAETAATAEAEG